MQKRRKQEYRIVLENYSGGLPVRGAAVTRFPEKPAKSCKGKKSEFLTQFFGKLAVSNPILNKLPEIFLQHGPGFAVS